MCLHVCGYMLVRKYAFEVYLMVLFRYSPLKIMQSVNKVWQDKEITDVFRNIKGSAYP